MKVSVIIPTINEEKTIGKVISSIKLPYETDIIIVDSNSTDRTREIASSLGAIVINEPRRGYGRAYKTGFEHAKGDIIVTLDGDDTYPAEKIPELIETLIKEDLDFITCDRLSNLKEESMSFLHRLGNHILTISTRILYRIKINDSQSGMWIFRRDILENLDLTSDGMSFSEEIKIEAYRKGFKWKEIPIEYRPRVGEVKLNTWRDGFKNLSFLIKKRF